MDSPLGSPRYGLAFIEVDSGDRSIDSAELQHVLSMLVLTYLDSSNCINIRPSFGGGLVATMHLPTAIIDIINTNIDYVRRTARLPADFSLEQLDLLRMVALFGGPDTHIQFNTTLYPAQPLDQHYCDCVDRARATLVTNTIGSLQGELYSYLGRDHVMAVGLELANRDVVEIDYDPYAFPTFSVEIEGIVNLHGIIQTHPDSGRPMRIKLRRFNFVQ